MKRWRASGALLLVSLLTLGFDCAQQVAEPCGPQDPEDILSIESFELVDSQRITRTRFEYTYRATVTNSQPPDPAYTLAAIPVRATVTSLDPATSIVDGGIEFPTLLEGASAASTDTFSFTQDRTAPFDRSQLCFVFDAYTLEGVVPDLRGRPREQALEIVEANTSLELGHVDFQNDPIVSLGSVASQQPAAGSLLLDLTSVDLWLSLGPEFAEGFGMSLPVGSGSMGRGSAALFPVAISRESGFVDPVEVTLENPPAGITANVIVFDPTLSEGRLTISASVSLAPSGPLDLIVIARSGDETVRRLLKLTITAPVAAPRQAIHAALAAGEIGIGDALVYRMFAMYGDPRLPPEYQGSGEIGEDSTLHADIRLNEAQLTPEQSLLLRPYLVRPTDPESIWSQSAEGAASVAGAARFSSDFAAAGAPTLTLLESPHCPVPTVGTTWIYQRSADPEVPVIVWARCAEGALAAGAVQFADLAVQVARETVDRAWPHMTGLMGPAILDNGTSYPMDIDSSIDLFVLHNPNEPFDRAAGASKLGENLGLTISVDVGLDPKTSDYVEILGSLLWHGDGYASFRGSIVHELFHVLQDAHNGSLDQTGSFGLPDTISLHQRHWFVEASAQWAKAHYDRTLGWSSRMGGSVHDWFSVFQQVPEESLNEPEFSEMTSPSGRTPYAAYVWPLFGELALGPIAGAEAVGAIWQEFGTVSGSDFTENDAIIDEALPFSDHFADFALTNLNQSFEPGADPLPESQRYKSLDPEFPDGEAPQPALEETLSGSDLGTNSYAISVRPLATAYARLTVDQGNGSTRALVVDWSELAPADELNVDAVVFNQADGWRLRRLKNKTRETFCVRGSGSPALDLWLVFSNSAHAPADAWIEGQFSATTVSSSSECGCTGTPAFYCAERLEMPDASITSDLSRPLAIDSAGRIAGSYTYGFGAPVSHRGPLPVVWNSPNSPVNLLPPASLTGFATDLNDSRQVVGYVADFTNSDVALWDDPSTPPIALVPGGFDGIGPRINAVGDVAFVPPFGGVNGQLTLWRDGTLYNFGLPAAGVWDLNGFSHILFSDTVFSPSFHLMRGAKVTPVPLVVARGLNDFGVVVGAAGSAFSADQLPARWRDREGVKLLNVPPPPAPPPGYALTQTLGAVNAINNRGEMVGYVSWRWDRIVPIPGGVNWVAESTALYWPDTQGFRFELTDLIPQNSGICIVNAVAINDRGQIAASGTWFPGRQTPGCNEADQIGFRLTPAQH